MKIFKIEKNKQGSVVQHTIDSKQSEPPGSEVKGYTSDTGVSKLLTVEKHIQIYTETKKRVRKKTELTYTNITKEELKRQKVVNTDITKEELKKQELT